MRFHVIGIVALIAMLLPSCFATQYGIPAYIGTVNNGAVGRSGNAESSDMLTGKACANSILGYIAVGDASIQAAARKNGIKQIASVSHTTSGVLGVSAEYCTIVRGWQ